MNFNKFMTMSIVIDCHGSSILCEQNHAFCMVVVCGGVEVGMVVVVRVHACVALSSTRN